MSASRLQADPAVPMAAAVPYALLLLAGHTGAAVGGQLRLAEDLAEDVVERIAPRTRRLAHRG